MQEESKLWRALWTSVLAGAISLGAYLESAKGKDEPINPRNHLKSIDFLVDAIPIREIRREIKLPQPNNQDNYVSQQKSSQNQRQSNEQINYRTTNLQTDPIDLLLARLIYGEARSCSKEERGSVGKTPLTRSGFLENKDEERLRKIMLKNNKVRGKIVWQYSCFGDHNREKLMNPTEIKAFEECLKISRGILLNQLPDYSNGSDHYHARNISEKPKWAKKMTPLPPLHANQSHIFYDSKQRQNGR